ncbi:hypothetical protein Scep_028383 [Stephania cephalantha]|uniref:Cytochrome P450 n=1 Tax=Stephania cephalantha TaxID=152367 RepID=A0AAP0E9V1_9MAGN
MERQLRRQGVRGTPYKLLHGDLKESSEALAEAYSKPILLSHSHSIAARVMPYVHRTVQKYGTVRYRGVHSTVLFLCDVHCSACSVCLLSTTSIPLSCSSPIPLCTSVVDSVYALSSSTMSTPPLPVVDNVDFVIVRRRLVDSDIRCKVTYFWAGVTPRIIVADQEMLKDILSNKSGDFPKPDTNPLTKLLVTGFATYNGEKWAKHKKIIQPAFHFDKLKVMFHSIHDSCSDMIKRWERLEDSNGSFEVDVWPEFLELTGDIISKTGFGSNFEDGRRIFQILKELSDLAIQTFQSVYIPGFKYIPTKRNTRMKKLEKEFRDSIMEKINKRVGQSRNEDLLGMLLESNSEFQKLENSKNAGMTISDIIDECKLFYIAGHETTSSLLTWTIVMLSYYPEWQARARDEVLQVFNSSSKLDFDALNHLKIVTMILNEVMRVYPPVALLLRNSHKEMQVGKITLPAGVQIGLPILLVHHDRDLWGDDVDEFKPERFAGGVSNATNNQLCYFPFSWGPRGCIGQSYAMLEAKLAVAMILLNFSFELSPTYVHAPSSILVLYPQHGAHITFHKL